MQYVMYFVFKHYILCVVYYICIVFLFACSTTLMQGDRKVLPGELKMKHWAAVWGPMWCSWRQLLFWTLFAPISAVRSISSCATESSSRVGNTDAAQVRRGDGPNNNQPKSLGAALSVLGTTPHTRDTTKSDKMSSWFKGSSPAPVVKI